MQGRAIALFESVYARDKQHPGRAALPHSRLRRSRSCRKRFWPLRVRTRRRPPQCRTRYHMPSHIFTRLGYWDEAATTNENAWRISNDDVKAGGRAGRAARLPFAQLPLLQLPSARPLQGCEEGGRSVRGTVRSDHEPQDCSRLAGPSGPPRAWSDDLRAARSRALRLLRHPRPLHRRIGIVERRAGPAAHRAIERFRGDEAASRGDGRGQAEGRRHGEDQSGGDDGASARPRPASVSCSRS